jgi:hypothetical protein
VREAIVTGALWNAVRKMNHRVREFFDAPLAADARPLELLQAALDELETKTQPSGRGARVFPYNRVVVHIAQPNADRAAIDAVFSRLDARVRERLTEIRCEIPPSLAASATVSDAADADTPVLRVEYGNDADARPAAAPPPEVPELRLTVAKGQCERGEYAFTGGSVPIGRGAEPADAFGRVRRNEVAFLDVRDGVTETVARAHARVEFDRALRAYVLFNESVSNPTFIVRAGRSLRVGPRDPRGVRLQSGDQLQVGRAILNVLVG